MKKNASINWLATACLTLSPIASGAAGARIASPPAAIGYAEGPSREYAVKAAFIYNFAQFVEWPADAFADDKAPIVIGTLGSDPFHGGLEQVLAGKAIGGRKLTVKHFEGPDDIKGCHVLFVGADAQVAAVVKKTAGLGGGILLIGDGDRFLNQGGMIRFFQEDKKLRFEINVKGVEEGRLHISSKLLKLAKIFNG